MEKDQLKPENCIIKKFLTNIHIPYTYIYVWHLLCWKQKSEETLGLYTQLVLKSDLGFISYTFFAKKSKSKSLYNWWSVSQSVLASSLLWDPWLYFISVRSDHYSFIWLRLPSLLRGWVCHSSIILSSTQREAVFVSLSAFHFWNYQMDLIKFDICGLHKTLPCILILLFIGQIYPYPMCTTGSSFPGYKVTWGWALTTYLHLVPMLRMSREIYPLLFPIQLNNYLFYFLLKKYIG